MSNDSIKQAISITTFAVSVIFSSVLFCFSIYEVSKQPDSALWMSMTVGLVNLYLPSPLNLLSQGVSSSSSAVSTPLSTIMVTQPVTQNVKK
jgi:hypothetical protein